MITQLWLGCTYDEIMGVLRDYYQSETIAQYVAVGHLRFDPSRCQYVWEDDEANGTIPEIVSGLPITGVALSSRQIIKVRGFNDEFGPEVYPDGTLRVKCRVDRISAQERIQCIEVKSNSLELARAEMLGVQASLLRRELLRTAGLLVRRYIADLLRPPVARAQQRFRSLGSDLFQEPPHG